MNLKDFLTTYAAPKPPRIQARPQPAPTRTLADSLRAHAVPAQRHPLDALAHTAALDPKSADQVIALTDEIVSSRKLTTLMVTHAMQQAVNLGDRIVMMHRGNVLHDVGGAAKRRLRVDDLLGRFEDMRRRELLDESAASLLALAYV